MKLLSNLYFTLLTLLPVFAVMGCMRWLMKSSPVEMLTLISRYRHLIVLVLSVWVASVLVLISGIVFFVYITSRARSRTESI